VPTATAADVGSSLVRSKHARSGFPRCRTWQWSRRDGEAGDGVCGGFDGQARLQVADGDETVDNERDRGGCTPSSMRSNTGGCYG
jgi:hypothetical protein